MKKYKFDHQDNTWTTLISNGIKENTLNDVTDQFVKQLQTDQENLNKNNPITDCALFTPRLYSATDKQHQVGHLIATKLFPINDAKPANVNKKWTYIQYQRCLSKLSYAFMTQIEKEQTLNSQFREVRKTHQRKYFCELKNRPLSDLILNPTPMPVTVAPLEELEPFYNHLTLNTPVTEPIKEFIRGVQYNDGRMDLCKQVVGPPHIGKLMQSLKNNTHIEHFLLGNNIIGLNGAKAINEFLLNEHAPKIKTWYLAGNEIDSASAQLLYEALKDDTICEALWLKRNPIKPLGAVYIAKLLESNNHIKILDLCNTGILDEGINYIFQALYKNTTLKHLYLDADGITIEGAKCIAKYFDYLVENNKKGLTSLWVDINKLDDTGVILIAQSLKNYKYLKRFVAGSNMISDVGTKAICDALTDSPCIVLDLGLYKSTSDLNCLPNNMGDKGAQHIAEFIKNNKSVEVLSTLHNDITVEGITMINDALQQNNTLMFLYYEQYAVDISQSIRLSIRNKLTENIKNKYNLTYDEFVNNKLRYIKGSTKLKNIDSVYRNRM